MDILTIILIGVGLSMDALAISVSCGFSQKGLKVWQALRVALFFGGFQAVMPVLGWLLGSQFAVFIETFDHWIAFGLLSFIGAKMVYESFSTQCDEDKTDLTKLGVLFWLSVATSIDALAVGLSFAFLNVNVLFPALIIGVVTFCISILGILFGRKLGHWFGNKLELIGGLVLIGIGIKILIEHLFFM